MNEIAWDDPPERKGRGGSLDWFWAELRANPGRWARYPGKASSVLSVIRTKPDKYECTTRGTEGERRAWVRYIGANGDGSRP